MVSYIGRFAPAVAVPLASLKSGEPATELTSSRSNTTNGDATPPAHYSFRLAGWPILSLNSEEPLDPDSRQLRWLRRQVSGTGDCRLAFWHRPRFSAGKHGDQQDIDPLWQTLRGRARMVVNGHEHNLQRLQPIDGTTELIAGAGGKSHYDLDEDDERLAFARDDIDGALRLELSARLARYRFIASDGVVLDAGSVRCTT